MNDMDKTLPQLAVMLRIAEKNMKGKRKAILMVNNRNGKGKYVVKPSTKALKPTRSVAKECFYYGKTKHWKRI